ncbi:MAG: hypothetical protein KatS3mg070_1383 [Meiothermus sp.]|uniref:hypothetical protein n=1 Tax=Meiothermus sp. TaxID=1955249 RepID=UPI0021DC010A|nr:hypothetical protein [Meiothermus sp.]GIW28020.1 MAG: hypothetical protein KatS3mg070_1383 [Meiothermus sp.]
MEQLRLNWLRKPAVMALLVLATFGAGYWAGLRSVSGIQGSVGSGQHTGQFELVQFDQQQQPTPAPDPRELIPLQPGPGQGPGQPQPGQGQGEECPLLIYQDGQLFRFDLPGQPLPGPGGPLPGPGMPGGSPELIPLDPNAPALPSPPSQPTPAPAPTPPDSNPDQSI